MELNYHTSKMRKSGLSVIEFLFILIIVSSLNAMPVKTIPVALSEECTSIIFEDFDSIEGIGGNAGARFWIVHIASDNTLKSH